MWGRSQVSRRRESLTVDQSINTLCFWPSFLTYFSVTGTRSPEESVPDTTSQPAEKMEKTPVSRETIEKAAKTTEDRAAEVVAPSGAASKALKRGPETETVHDAASGGKKARDETTAGPGTV